MPGLDKILIFLTGLCEKPAVFRLKTGISKTLADDWIWQNQVSGNGDLSCWGMSSTRNCLDREKPVRYGDWLKKTPAPTAFRSHLTSWALSGSSPATRWKAGPAPFRTD